MSSGKFKKFVVQQRQKTDRRMSEPVFWCTFRWAGEPAGSDSGVLHRTGELGQLKVVDEAHDFSVAFSP